MKWPYPVTDAPPASVRVAVMEMPDLIMYLHSFLDLLRRDTEAWRALLRCSIKSCLVLCGCCILMCIRYDRWSDLHNDLELKLWACKVIVSGHTGQLSCQIRL